ncbi:Cystinosin-like [Pseudocercospora fuligena]|uniref:Cystinosin-like n=1 Tax=Pseudocercospora fuligena TaxID=685502 RepID=A0A8H6R6G2_9PEZI|nr:Cystinosin-like [Pseudocercospora fuligena]
MYKTQNNDFWILISRLCGWTYTILWSVSYYPQPFLNWQRKSTNGFIFDFPLMNVIGSLCYTISTGLFLYSGTVREEYAARHPESPEPTARFNDFCYGFHSLVLCSVTFSQFWPGLWGWKRAAKRNPNRLTISILLANVIGTCSCIVLVILGKLELLANGSWEWIDVAYALTYVKLSITVFKYWPQVLSIYRRKSTAGLTMLGVSLDFIGGILSLIQLIIDCSLQADWSGLTGNLLKLGLANISMLADTVFLTQRYVLYGAKEIAEPEHSPEETDALLPK